MKKIFAIMMSAIFVLMGSQLIVNASDTYSASPVTSEHQTKDITSFFDIRWTPSATDHFAIRVTNNSKQSKTYTIQINKARTNKYGTIDYSNTEPESDATQYKLTKMVQIDKEVTVAAGQSKEVSGTISFPKESFNGILMAGVHVSEKQTQNSKSMVSNTVSYEIPLVVRGDNDTRPKANISFKKFSLDKVTNTQSSLDIQLSNDKATLLKNSKFTAEIQDKNGKKVVSQKSTISITPETIFTYPIKLPSNMKAGDYQFVLKIKHAKDQWVFKKNFHITNKESKKIRDMAGVKDYTWLYCAIGVIVLLLLIILFLLFKRRKRKNDEQSTSRRSRRK